MRVVYNNRDFGEFVIRGDDPWLRAPENFKKSVLLIPVGDGWKFDDWSVQRPPKEAAMIKRLGGIVDKRKHYLWVQLPMSNLPLYKSTMETE